MNSVPIDESRGEWYKAIGFLVVTAILWSSAGLLLKMISWNSIAIAGIRSAIAAIVLLAFLRRPHLTWSSAQIGGAIAYTVTVILFVSANKLTTAANAILLQYTSPIYVALFGAWFLGERATWLDWTTILVVIGGMGLFFLDDLATGGSWGNVCAISCGVTFACFVLFMRKQKGEAPGPWAFLGGFIVLISVTIRYVVTALRS